MQKHKLTAEKRALLGRKVKKLRQSGKIPGTVYGKDIASLSVAVTAADFDKIYKEAGTTGIVELTLDKETRPILIHHVQSHPVSGNILHVEFHQINLKEKVKTRVPLEFTGEAPAVSEKKGVVLPQLDEIEIEALPTDLPEKIEVDISGLAQVGQEIRVKDLKLPTGIEVLTEPEAIVLNVGELVSKAAEEAAAEEAAAAAAQVAAPVEGAVPEAAEEAGAAEVKPAEPCETEAK